MNRTRWMLAAVAATALLAGCSSAASTSAGSTSAAGTSAAGTSASNSAAASFPVTLAASPGPVTIKARPGRIVSLSATATEDLYAVGAGPQVVAVDDDSDYPANAPVTKLSGLTPNLEAIAKYKPALVIASQNSNGLVSGLGKLGVPVLIEPAVATLDGAYDQIVQIGQATGHTQQAGRTVAAMKSEIAADVKQAGKSHQGLTYYWELSANPYYSVTSATFIGQIVGLFGLKNIADAADKASDGGYPELSEEYVVTARPQIIFLADNQPADGGQSAAIVAKRPGWSAIPAVQDHEIIALNDDIASRWGPRLPQLVAQIAQAVEKVPGS
ncbi:MAG: ABC transporter substrate-binding protein [Streptosporangiaceae bacterium]|jgi:iron complex transport system substrate-binding protein